MPAESRLVARLRDTLASTEGRRPFLVSSQSLTYGELKDRIERFTTLVRERGVRPGDPVVLATASDVDAAAIYLSLVCAGMTAVVVDPRSTATELRTVVEHVRARAIVA